MALVRGGAVEGGVGGRGSGGVRIMGEQIVSTRGNSSDQGKSKAEVNQPVLPFCFIQIFRKIRVLYLRIA